MKLKIQSFSYEREDSFRFIYSILKSILSDPNACMITIGDQGNPILDFSSRGIIYKNRAILFFSKAKSQKEWHMDVYRPDQDAKMDQIKFKRPVLRYCAILSKTTGFLNWLVCSMSTSTFQNPFL